MAHKNDYQIQKQLDKPQTWFCKYYPARIRNVGEKEIAAVSYTHLTLPTIVGV